MWAKYEIETLGKNWKREIFEKEQMPWNTQKKI